VSKKKRFGNKKKPTLSNKSRVRKLAAKEGQSRDSNLPGDELEPLDELGPLEPDPECRKPRLSPVTMSRHQRRRERINGNDEEDNSLLRKATDGEGGDTPVRGRGDSGLILTDPHRVRSDLALLEKSVSKGYNIRRKTMMRRRLEDIACKTEADVVVKGKDGCTIVHSESKADELAAKAIKILVDMDTQDCKRLEMLKDKPNLTGSAPSTIVNVNVNNSDLSEAERRRLEIIGIAQRLGASRLTLDGRAVNIGVDAESTSSVSEDATTDPKPSPNGW